MSSWKSDLFAQFRVFYNKEFTRQKKSYKQIIQISTVCSNRQARRERAVGEMEFGWLCVDVVVYIEGYYFGFIEILRIRGLSMFRFDLHSLRNQNKKSIERRSRLLKQIIF